MKTYDYKTKALLTTIGMKGTGNGQVKNYQINWYNLEANNLPSFKG